MMVSRNGACSNCARCCKLARPGAPNILGCGASSSAFTDLTANLLLERASTWQSQRPNHGAALFRTKNVTLMEGFLRSTVLSQDQDLEGKPGPSCSNKIGGGEGNPEFYVWQSELWVVTVFFKIALNQIKKHGESKVQNDARYGTHWNHKN